MIQIMMTGKVMEVMPNEEVSLKVKTVEVMTIKLMTVKKLKIPGDSSSSEEIGPSCWETLECALYYESIFDSDNNPVRVSKLVLSNLHTSEFGNWT